MIQASPKLWIAACILLAATLAVPFLMVDVPPVLDYPNHLAGYYVLAHPMDPVLSRFYAPHWAVLPNLAGEVLGVALIKIFPVHVAGRMVLATALAAPVIGSIIYARAAFGRLTFWSLGSGLAAYNGLFFLGFINFLIGLGLALAGAGVWAMARRRGPFPAVAVGVLFSTLLFFCHVTSVLFFAILICAQEFDGLVGSGAPQRRRWLTAGLTLAGAFAPAAFLILAFPLAGPHRDIVFEPWRRMVWELVTPFLTYDLSLSLLTLAAVVLTIGFRGAKVAPGAILAFTALAALYVVTPFGIANGTFVSTRIPVMAGVLLFAALSPRLSPRAALAAAIVVSTLLILRTGQIARVWFDHRRELAQFREAIRSVPPGAKVLATYGYGGDPSVDQAPGGLAIPGLYYVNLHMPALLVIERHAFWPLLFANPHQQPLMVRPPYDRLAYPLGELFDAHLLAQDPPSPDALYSAPYLPAWRSHFDYVLVLNVLNPPLNTTPPARGLDAVSVNQTAGLYAVRRP